MKIDIKCHYWPATPNVREIKIQRDNNTITSEFLDKQKILQLAGQFLKLREDLIEYANQIKE